MQKLPSVKNFTPYTQKHSIPQDSPFKRRFLPAFLPQSSENLEQANIPKFRIKKKKAITSKVSANNTIEGEDQQPLIRIKKQKRASIILVPQQKSINLETQAQWMKLVKGIEILQIKSDLTLFRANLFRLHKQARTIQKAYISYKTYKKKKQQSAVLIQSHLRSYTIRKRIIKTLKSIIQLQSWTRMSQQRFKYKEILISITKIQYWYKAKYLRSRFLSKLKSIQLIQFHIRLFLKRLHSKQLKASILIQSFLRMHRHRKPFLKHWTEKKRRQEQQRMIEEQKRRAEEYRKKKEAVRIIEKFWGLIMLRKDLREKRKQWANLPKDCRMLWIRFSCLKEQAFDLREEIRYLKKKE